MPGPNQVIHLEKFTVRCRTVIAEAQLLADEMRHSKITLLHLRASVEAFVETEELLARATKGFKPTLGEAIVAKFKQMSEIDSRYAGSVTEQLQRLERDAEGPRTAYLTADFIKFLKFTEEQAGTQNVTLKILLHELICTMRDV
jgi:hypothetical protein